MSEKPIFCTRNRKSFPIYTQKFEKKIPPRKHYVVSSQLFKVTSWFLAVIKLDSRFFKRNCEKIVILFILLYKMTQYDT